MDIGESMRVCSKCGKPAGNQDIVCGFCGGPLSLGDTGRLLEMSAGAPTPRDDVKSAIDSRMATDAHLSPMWTLVSLLMVAPIIGALCIFLLTLLMLSLGSHMYFRDAYVFILVSPPVGTAVFAILFGLLTYRMIDRLNRHIDREERLRAALMSYVRSEARKSGREQGIMDDLLRLSSFDGQATVYEKKFDPRLWGWGIFAAFITGPLSELAYYLAIIGGAEDMSYLIAISIVFSISAMVMLVSLVMTLILASHLMRTIATHEQRWHGFTGSFQAALSVAGKEIELPVHDGPRKARSVLLYCILTAVTLGVFAVHWLYVLIKDPNTHFAEQHETEDAILGGL